MPARRDGTKERSTPLPLRQRVLLAAAVIAGAQWAVITFWPGNTTLVWVVLGIPALLAGYTEGDCVHAARGSLPEPGVAYFRQLVGAWQGVAYGAQTPPAAGVEQLCGTWSQYFAKPIP